MAVILIVRVPNRPSRPKTISIPSARSGVCARRSRPASARGLFGQPDRVQAAIALPPTLMPTCKRSDALPVHCARSAMSSRTWAATGSASTMFSIASRRLFVISGFKGARGSKCALACCGPEREISHARQPPEAYLRQHAVSHARPHRGARQECAVGRARTPAIAQSPAGVAVRQSVRASAG